MQTSRTFSPSSGIDHAALLDELVKIGKKADRREPERKPLRHAVGTAILSGVGTGAGMAVAHEVGRYLSKKPPTQGGAQAAKIILPILGGAAVVLGNELRKMKSERYSKVRGYQGGGT